MGSCLMVAACGGSGDGGDSGTGGGGGGGGATAYSIAVDVHGFGAADLVLLNNGADALTVDADGRYAFRTALAAGQPYSVSVRQQPFSQVCVVTGGSGVVADASPAVIGVECVNKVVSHSTGLWLHTRSASGVIEQFLYARSRLVDLHPFRIRSVDGGLDPAGPAWSPFAPSPYLASFLLAPDGSAAYADDLLGQIRAATIRESDGVVVPSWSGELAQYSPQLPVLLGAARISPDGQMLYRNFTALIGGRRYADLWVGAVDPLGLSTVSGSPFPLASDGGGPHFDPRGRFFARASSFAGQIEVYQAFSSTTQSPQNVGSYPVSFSADTNYALVSEEPPGRLLYETRTAITIGVSPPGRPDIAVNRWREDGVLERVGAPLSGGVVSGEIASQVCSNGETTTRRLSPLTVLPGVSGDHRYVLQRQDAYCRSTLGTFGSVVDTRVLGLFLLRMVDGQTELLRLAVDSLPGWSDLGGFGWAHPGRPWLYVGSKFSQRIYGYEVDRTTGSVQPLAGSPFEGASVHAPSGTTLPALIMDPTGKYLYMARFPDEQPPHFIHAFSISQSNGALTAVATYSLP
jgi:hypothetical protein